MPQEAVILHLMLRKYFKAKAVQLSNKHRICHYEADTFCMSNVILSRVSWYITVCYYCLCPLQKLWNPLFEVSNLVFSFSYGLCNRVRMCILAFTVFQENGLFFPSFIHLPSLLYCNTQSSTILQIIICEVQPVVAPVLFTVLVFLFPTITNSLFPAFDYLAFRDLIEKLSRESKFLL